jgi:ppGpp synthetase/RelA/SpoT-type nucleotidyltranferase
MNTEDGRVQKLEQLLFSKIGHVRLSRQRVDAALQIAKRAHENQFRESNVAQRDRLPYITHVIGVAITAIQYWQPDAITDSLEDVVCACLLHDVIEDSAITAFEIEENTTPRVTEIVLALTKPPVSSKVNRERREDLFLEQITQFGPTAIYVKLCDILHNLESPETTPSRLLHKLTRRATKSVPVLLQALAFKASSLSEQLDHFLHCSRNELRTRLEPGNAAAASFEEAVARTHEFATAKSLELHDVCEWIGEITGCALPTLDTIDNYFRVDVLRRVRIRDQKLLRQLRHDLTSGALVIPSVDSGLDSDSFGLALKILCSPICSSSGEQAGLHIFLLLPVSSSSWLTPVALQTLVAILCLNRITRQQQLVVEAAQRVGRVGLTLDPVLVSRCGLSFGNLLELKRILKGAEALHSMLQNVIEWQIDDSGLASTIDRFESRVKTADSVVRKMNSRNWQDLSRFDDIVGFRIVVGSSGAAEKLSGWIATMLAKHARKLGLYDETSSPQVLSISAPTGYRAIHLRMSLRSPINSSDLVPCEIQIRTLMQDMWARLSYLALYKHSKRSPEVDSKLRELSLALQHRESDLISLFP